MEKCTEIKIEETKNVANDKNIQIIDEEGYDIEQFLCRCSNKTSIMPW